MTYMYCALCALLFPGAVPFPAASYGCQDSVRELLRAENLEFEVASTRPGSSHLH